MAFTAGEIFGTAGVTILLLAFIMNLLKKWKQESLLYILCNLVGAGLACISSLFIHFIPFVVLEATWTIVSLIALIKNIRMNFNQKRID